MVTTSVVTVPKILGRKTGGLIVTHIMSLQETDLLFLNNVTVKQAGLFYANKVATASVVTVPKILGRKTSELIVIQIRWPQQSWLLFPIFLAAKQAGLLLHK